MNRIRGVTLIELLIVVAVIAILAATTMGILLNTSDRAKVAHARNEMMLIRNALDAYEVEHNALPPNVVEYNQPEDIVRNGAALWRLTTPISYISYSSLEDPYPLKGRHTADFGYWQLSPSHGDIRAIILSPGPNRLVDTSVQFKLAKTSKGSIRYSELNPIEYDPTNGIHSSGDVITLIPGSEK